MFCSTTRRLATCGVALVVWTGGAWIQGGRGTAATPPASAAVETPADSLGRATPRGTLVGFVAGASLIVDAAVRVSDFVKLAEIQGTVDYIGVRSQLPLSIAAVLSRAGTETAFPSQRLHLSAPAGVVAGLP